MGFLEQNKTEVLIAIVIALVGISFLNGWLVTETIYVLVFVGIMVLIIVFSKKKKAEWNWKQGLLEAQKVFRDFSGHFVPIKEYYEKRDDKIFSRKGRLMIVFGEDGPRRPAVGIDLASRKIPLATKDVRSDYTFLNMLYDKPSPQAPTPVMYKKQVEVKEEQRPS